MSTGYTAKNVILDDTTQTLGASVTNQLLSSAKFHIFAEDSLHFRADIAISAITVAAAVTATLQHSYDGTNWDVAKTFALTTTGRRACTMLVEVAADQAILPLRPFGRFVITTGAGDSATITGIFLTRRP